MKEKKEKKERWEIRKHPPHQSLNKTKKSLPLHTPLRLQIGRNILHRPDGLGRQTTNPIRPVADMIRLRRRDAGAVAADATGVAGCFGISEARGWCEVEGGVGAGSAEGVAGCVLVYFCI